MLKTISFLLRDQRPHPVDQEWMRFNATARDYEMWRG